MPTEYLPAFHILRSVFVEALREMRRFVSYSLTGLAIDPSAADFGSF